MSQSSGSGRPDHQGTSIKDSFCKEKGKTTIAVEVGTAAAAKIGTWETEAAAIKTWGTVAALVKAAAIGTWEIAAAAGTTDVVVN